MAGPILKGETFAADASVTNEKLHDLVEDALFIGNTGSGVTFNVSGSTDIGTCVKDGGLEVASGTGQLQIEALKVTTAKIANSAVTSAKLSLTDGVTVKKTGASEVIASFVTDQGSSTNRGLFIQTPDSATDTDFPVVLNTGNSISFEVDNSEAMRIDTGRNVFIGKSVGTNDVTTAGHIFQQGGKMVATIDGDSNQNFVAAHFNATGTTTAMDMFYNSSVVGSITKTASATSFNTSSDYRLKEDIVEIQDSIERVKELKPCNFAWKVDGTRVDGFLAHEAQEIVPEAVTGTKDAVDEDGQPEYQGIDQSKLIPLLTKALQESLTEIEALKARVSALES